MSEKPEEAVEEEVKMVPAPKQCPHINKQYFVPDEGLKGREDLECELDEGHVGEHYNSSVVNGYWNNDAGIELPETIPAPKNDVFDPNLYGMDKE
jgi:hypothetical protein